MDKLLLVLLIFSMLYALYYYQQYIFNLIIPKNTSKKPRKITLDDIDDISLDHLSQTSIDSLSSKNNVVDENSLFDAKLDEISN